MLPLLATTILSAAAIVFLFAFTSFGVILILGGPGGSPRWRWRFTARRAQLLDLRVAAAWHSSSWWALGALLLVCADSERRAVRTTTRWSDRRSRTTPGAGERGLVIGNFALMGVLIGLPPGSPGRELARVAIRKGYRLSYSALRRISTPDRSESPIEA